VGKSGHTINVPDPGELCFRKQFLKNFQEKGNFNPLWKLCTIFTLKIRITIKLPENFTAFTNAGIFLRIYDTKKYNSKILSRKEYKHHI